MAEYYEAAADARDPRVIQVERVVALEGELATQTERSRQILRDRDEVAAALDEAREKLHALLGVRPEGTEPTQINPYPQH